MRVERGEMNLRKVIITGGTGFIGSNVARQYAANDWDVQFITRKSSRYELCEDFLDKVTVYNYDGEIKELIDILATVKPDMVIHLASFFVAEHKVEDIDMLIKSNLEYGVHLLEAMRLAGVKKLINTSTSWEHYNNEEYNPVCLYSATKKAFSDILKYYEEAENFVVVTLKLFDTYGPGDNRKKLFNLLINSAKNDVVLQMSPGEQYIDLVYIDDVVSAFRVCGEMLCDGKLQSAEQFAITSGKPIKLKEVVELFNQISTKKVNILWGKRPYRNREVMLPWTSGKKLIHWNSKISLKEGIERILCE